MKYVVYNKSSNELVESNAGEILFDTKKEAEKVIDGSIEDGWNALDTFEVFCVSQVYSLSEPSDVKYLWEPKDI